MKVKRILPIISLTIALILLLLTSLWHGKRIVSAASSGEPATLSISDTTVDEGATATFTVTLSPSSIDTVTVTYATGNITATSGADYTSTTGTLVFTPGQTVKTVMVETIDDADLEGDENFKLSLTGVEGSAEFQSQFAVTANPFYTITGGYGDMAFGKGGFYGTDLYIASVNTFGVPDGNIYRVVDSNNDGVGEGSVLLTNPTNPISIAFDQFGNSGLGDGMFILDYPSSSSQRWVYTATNSGPTPTVARFSNQSIFNPALVEFTADGIMLVSAAQAFTVFGGSNDGRIYRIDNSGNVTEWANGSNTTHGLWDNNAQLAMRPDGCVVNWNQAIRPGGVPQPNELWLFCDNNSDNDANDAGEATFLADASSVVPIRGTYAFDEHGDLLLGKNSSNSAIYRLSDVNNDGDYWDATARAPQFDAGELITLTTGILGFPQNMIIRPDGTIWLDTVDVAAEPDRTIIYRVEPDLPTGIGTIVDNETPTAVRASTQSVNNTSSQPHLLLLTLTAAVLTTSLYIRRQRQR